MYMLILEIYSEHLSHLYNFASGPTFLHVKFVTTVIKRIIISNYSYNKICDQHTVDMLLLLNTIDEFLITRSIDVKRVYYNDPSHLRTYH
jgi:hypothetical protein